ncbi:MAG: hypothetical protein HYZ27_11345, partial [Deltaproteobacteria bacterium]|nr:hypothetical protein [Deltaproteobacteria bacterium]
MRPLLGVLLIVSCAEPGAEGPAPRQVSPSRGAAATEVAITITGEHFEPLVFADYRSGAGHVAADFQAQLEDGEGGVVPLGEVTWLASHTLTARVPASAPRGRFDLVVSDPLGRSGRLWSAFQLVSSAENVAAFTVDVAGMPTAGVPFVVRVTAVDLEGATVGGFEGSVGVTGPGLAAANFGPFERGVFRGFVTAPAPAQQLTLVAEDEAGRRGESAPFDVVHGPATQVEFLGGPSAAEAGACVGPFDVERR